MFFFPEHMSFGVDFSFQVTILDPPMVLERNISVRKINLYVRHSNIFLI